MPPLPPAAHLRYEAGSKVNHEVMLIKQLYGLGRNEIEVGGAIITGDTSDGNYVYVRERKNEREQSDTHEIPMIPKH